MGQDVLTRFYVLLDWEFHLEIFDGRIVSIRMWIIVHKQNCS